MQQRLYWLDIAKGMGITLVVVGHAGRGILNAGIADETGLLLTVDRAIYVFHMPLFFILAGITFAMRPPVRLYPDLSRKLWRLFYALMVWTYTFLVMRAIAGENTNAVATWEDLLVLPLPPVAHFWFLWALLVNIATFTALRMIFNKIISDILFWPISFLVLTATYLTLSIPANLIPYIGQALSYSLAFTTGGLIGSLPIRSTAPSRDFSIIMLVLFIAILITSMQVNIPEHFIIMNGIILSIILIIPIQYASDRFRDLLLLKLFALLGITSLAIYVMHTIFSATLRILLLKLSVDDPVLQLVFGSAAGVLGPLAAYTFARRYGLLRVAGLA